MPEGGEFTNQIQTEWMCYNCFVLWRVSWSKVPLACVWHEEWFYTAGPVPWNSAGGLADGKHWDSMPLSQNGFTMPTCMTFLGFGISTKVPLMLLISWLLALYARKATLVHSLTLLRLGCWYIVSLLLQKLMPM